MLLQKYTGKKEEIEMAGNGLKDVLAEMAGQIEGLIVTEVVGADGVPIVMYEAPGNKVNPDLAGAQFGEVLKLVTNAAAQMGAGGVEDNVTTTKTGYLITRPMGDGSCHLGIAATRDSSLGMLRLIARNYTDKLWDAVPGK